jgi:hypothetical protein
MHNITLISTVHKECGNCNSNELLKIIENICPDVIFLEALEENYSQYDHMKFSQFGVYKERLELKPYRNTVKITLLNMFQCLTLDYLMSLKRKLKLYLRIRIIKDY